MTYRLVGYDQFSNEEYDLQGEYDTLEAAKKAKADRTTEVLTTQYASPGFHDRTYIKDQTGKVVA